MSVRFALNTAFLLAAGFLVVASMAFVAPTAGWVAFGVSTGIAVAAVAGLVLARTIGNRLGQATIAAAGLWSLVAALIFHGPTLTWLVFADAIAVAGLAVAELVAHEVSTYRALRTGTIHELRRTRGAVDEARSVSPGQSATTQAGTGTAA